MNWQKQADLQSAASPLPQVEINPTPAPGKKGPTGLSPRSNFSRVNTGVPPVPDVGSAAQKSMEPRGAETLPKLAGSEVFMGQMTVRPTVNDMIKAAMAGAESRADISREAARQADLQGEEPTKTASAPTPSTPSYDEAEKLASALDYLAEEVEKEASGMGGHYSLGGGKVEPGKGPGSLHVSEAPGGAPFPSNTGHAHHTIPLHPGSQKGLPGEKGDTMLENTLNHAPGGTQRQQTALVGAKGLPKHASAIRAAAVKVANGDAAEEKREGEGMSEARRGLDKAEKAHESEKSARANALRTAQTKVAEDAINPAHITAGKAVMPDTRVSGEMGGTAPAGSQDSLIHSNEAAVNYTKREAKAVPKSDLHAYLTEPAQRMATDTTLAAAFNHTTQAGTKYAGVGAMAKTAQARQLMAKFAEAAAEKQKDKKEKESAMGAS